MALRWCDSFDHFGSTGVMTPRYDSNNLFSTAAGGRNGTNALSCVNIGATLTKILDSQSTWIVGFSRNRTQLNHGAFFRWVDNATTQVEFRDNALGKVEVYGNGGATLIGTSTHVISPATDNYYELKIGSFHDTTGSVEVRVNGVVEVSLTNVDTKGSANGTADRFTFLGSLSGQATLWDDFYVCDGTGGSNNDFLGDCRVQMLLPNGDGNSSQWVGSDGNSTNNSLLVDEGTPNNDTDYVTSGTVSDKDTYAFGNLASTAGTVAGVQVNVYARKDDAGTRKIVTVARVSATEVDSADISVTTSYLGYVDLRETKPGGGAWTITDVNAAEFGVKVTA